MKSIYNKLPSRSFSGKSSSFVPENEEERALVTQLKALGVKVSHLPDYHFRGISLTWSLGEYSVNHISYADRKKESEIHQECAKVQELILKVLSPYPSTEQE